MNPLDNERDVLEKLIEFYGNDEGSLRDFAPSIGVSRAAFQRWLKSSPERQAAFNFAKAMRAEVKAEKSLDELVAVERGEDGLPTSATVALARAKSETLRWLAGRIDPQRWGDSISVEQTHTLRLDPDYMRNLLAKRERQIYAEVLPPFLLEITPEREPYTCVREEIEVLPTLKGSNHE